MFYYFYRVIVVIISGRLELIAPVVAVVVPSGLFSRFPVISVVVLCDGLRPIRGQFVVYFCRRPGFCLLVQTEVFLSVFFRSLGPVGVIIHSWFSADTFVESEVRECWLFRFAVSTKTGVSLTHFFLPALAVAGVNGGVSDHHKGSPRASVRSDLSSSRGYGDVNLLRSLTTTTGWAGGGELMISDVCWLMFSLGGAGEVPAQLLPVLQQSPLLLEVETLTPSDVNSRL